MDYTDTKDVSFIWFHTYDSPDLKTGCRRVKLDVFNTSRGEALEIREILETNPCVGFVHIGLSGNKVI